VKLRCAVERRDWRKAAKCFLMSPMLYVVKRHSAFCCEVIKHFMSVPKADKRKILE
jgi:hypothetical protein